MSDEKEIKNTSADDLYHDIEIPDTLENEEDFFKDISESLKQQVNNELGDSKSDTNDHADGGETLEKAKPKKKHTGIKITGSIILALIAVLVFLVATPMGRKIIFNVTADVASGQLDNEEAEKNKDTVLFTKPTQSVEDDGVSSKYRKEEYVANFLLFGIEEIGGGGRTDSIMIASVNIKDKTIKLTSIMRDCYVEIPGHGSNKINAAFSFGGADLLVDTVQENFKIAIDGYACVNFESFEQIVDLLGGVEIELGTTEANYLNRTNYISNPSNRHVSAGWNTLNGNQALGYARVRKVATLGGANNDYGRTLRHRRLLNAIFDKYKSKNFLELLDIMWDVLPMIKTNLTSDHISDVLEQVAENGITTIDNYRIPAEDCYTDGKNECGSVLLLDLDANVNKLYEYIFLDVEEPTITPSTTVDGQDTTVNN